MNNQSTQLAFIDVVKVRANKKPALSVTKMMATTASTWVTLISPLATFTH